MSVVLCDRLRVRLKRTAVSW